MEESNKMEVIENMELSAENGILEEAEDSEVSEISENDETPESVEVAEEAQDELAEEAKNAENSEEEDPLIFVEEERFNVYDFDKTVLPYDSTAAFFIFCLKHQLSLIFAVIPAALSFPLFKLGIITKTRCKEIFYRFLTKLEDVDELVELFWRIKKRDFYPWYLSQKRSSDLIISASPDFLLRPICDELGVRLIASRVDKHTGKTEGLNNYGMEKLNRFRAEFPMAVIDEFYSDSLSDEPLAFIAKKAFFIKHGRPFPWPEHF